MKVEVKLEVDVKAAKQMGTTIRNALVQYVDIVVDRKLESEHVFSRAREISVQGESWI